MTDKERFIEFINSVDYSLYRIQVYGLNETLNQEVYHSFYEPKDILLNESLLNFDDNLLNSKGLKIVSWNQELKPNWLK